MKILQILPSLEMGGVERGTIEIAEALQHAGIPNAVISAGGPMVQQLACLGVEHITLPVKSKNPFVIHRNAHKIAEIAKSGGFTLMHVRSRAPAWSVKWASERCGVPWIATYHGVYNTEPRCLKIPYNRVMTQGTKVIAVSNFVREHIISTYGVDPNKVKLIHRGADTEYFRPAKFTPKQSFYFKNKYGIKMDVPVITLSGRLTRWKGQKVLLNALTRLRPQKYIGCLILGSDQGRHEYTEELKLLAKTLPQSILISFKERAENIADVYHFSDIVVNASTDPEAFGRTIPEAQACGVITVGTNHGGACETIRDGETGFLVPPNDVDALRTKLQQILDMPQDQLDKMRVAARKSVVENFSTQKMCAATIELYCELHGE